MGILQEPERSEFLAGHPAWTIDGENLSRTFEFSDFVQSIGFVSKVARSAEEAFHHPDIDIRWNRVTIRLSTHDEGGLTAKDTNLAKAIEELAGDV